MSARRSTLGPWVLVLVALAFVGGCERPTSPSPPPSPVAVKAVPDSALVDSVAAAVDRFKALRSPNAADRTALRQWGQAAQTKGDSLRRTEPTQARTLLRRALTAYRQAGDSARVAATLRTLGQTHEHASQYDTALARYRSALRASRAAEDRAQTAELLHDVGDVRKAQGRYEEALAQYRSALSIKRELEDRQSIARTLNNAGLAHEYRGNYDSALTHYRESLSIKRELGDQEGIANTLNNVGIVQAIRGHYTEALARWEESLAIKRELGDEEGVARTLNNLGNIYKNQGRYTEALSRFRAALDIFQSLDQREEIATALNNIGTVHKRQGRYTKALSRYRASLAIKRELGDRQGGARTLANIGTLHLKRGRYEDALSYHRTSLSIKRELGDRRGIAVSLNDLGDVYARQGRPEKALGQYRRALQINREIGRRQGSTRTLVGIGDVHLNQERPQAAIDTLEQAIHLAEELRLSTTSPDARRSLLATQVDAYRALTTAHVRAGHADSALRAVEQARARLLADHLAGTAQGDTTFALPQPAALRGTLGQDEAALLYANTNTKRPLTVLAVTRDTTYARELPDSTVRVAVGAAYGDRLRRLRRQEGPLTDALGGDEPTSRVEDAPSLTEMVRLYRSVLTRDDRTAERGRANLARRLYDLLVAPIAEPLPPPETLTVIPAGALGYLPFETLVGPEEKYLVEATHVRYAQSLSVLHQLRQRDHPAPKRPLLAVGGADYGPSSPGADPLLVAEARGDSALRSPEQASAIFRSAERRLDQGQSPRPTYVQLGYDRWPPLYGTELEVRKLKRAVGPGTTLLTGAAATEERVRAMSTSGALARYRHLHFATHGIAVPEAPQLSALVLSQVGASDSLAARDGYLTMREIADLRLRADVAVLSACRTGLGRLVAGEGVVNLSHAFLRAGANATLVSQWRVLDWSTQQFMTAAYRRAQADTTSFAEAVTQVKREFIAGRFGERNADPLRWAPFVYYGRE